MKEEDGIITLATKNSIYKICVNKKKREMMNQTVFTAKNLKNKGRQTSSFESQKH